jgi:hypothetical protein
MKAYGGDQRFLDLALAGGEWSASHPGRFTPGDKAPGTRWIGGWVDTRTSLDDVENRKFFILPRLELRPLGRLYCSQYPHRLLYPGSSKRKNEHKFLLKLVKSCGLFNTKALLR